jgi:hypothetical protein
MADEDVNDPEVWIARGDKLAKEHDNVNSSTINSIGIKEAIRCYQRAAELAPGELTTWLHPICHQPSRLGQATQSFARVSSRRMFLVAVLFTIMFLNRLFYSPFCVFSNEGTTGVEVGLCDGRVPIL